jgi:L-amino acid N-acyltransferase YncA/predicted RNA-binding protein with PUA-like domain
VTRLKILFDTNAFYACEDVSAQRQHANAKVATDLKELAQRHGSDLFLHSVTESDIRATSNVGLREATLLKWRQWNRLASVRHRGDLLGRAGYVEPLSRNDTVDLAMLAALDNNAVDLLVTEDKRLRDHAEAAGLGPRTFSIVGAIEYLKKLFGEPVVLPTVHRRLAYEISREDSVFESLREDYPEFDGWWATVSNEHRTCLTIESESGDLEALAVLKVEDDRPYGLEGRVLKICTFKVATTAEGAKRGELVLKALFHYARELDADRMYVTVFDHHIGLVGLFRLFGFEEIETRSDRSELVMVKNLRIPEDASAYTPLEFNRLFGPSAVLVERAFVIPIQPKWHDILVPEARHQGRLFGEDPSGNAILKAYLSRSSIRQLAPGDLVIFYRSHDRRAATVIGVVEDTMRSRDPVALRRFVGSRTVYSDNAITAMCDTGDVLAILFRQDRCLATIWPLSLLKEKHVVSEAPQAIQQVSNEEGLKWLHDQLSAPR